MKEKELSEKARIDLGLVKRARVDGDQQAFTELLERYRDSIYSKMLAMVSDPTEAEDLTIEAFSKAFRKMDHYTETYAFSTWLYKIAYNNCVDFMRRKKQNTWSLDQSLDDDFDTSISNVFPSESLNPEEKLIKSQKKEFLHDIVKGLKPHYQQLIDLFYFQELSYEEISKQMNIPLGTVKAKLFRAREFLFQIYKERKRDL
jgi:RNA polymerase sigma-70 factor (ECF subfamily)